MSTTGANMTASSFTKLPDINAFGSGSTQEEQILLQLIWMVMVGKTLWFLPVEYDNSYC
jgi:hypothetical protein